MLAIIGKPKTAVAEIEEILLYDLWLTANFLKLEKFTIFLELLLIIVLLRVKRLKKIVLAFCGVSVMNQAVPGYCLEPRNHWRHSIKVSISAVELAKYKKLSEPEDISTSALLHDIGNLFLAFL